ncbi:MAG TPA: hypothetical protein VG476_06875, partial [Acidimicrobiales bacterium]|nr:hypothetical protein [Acidimicrobiales bacterium]
KWLRRHPCDHGRSCRCGARRFGDRQATPRPGGEKVARRARRLERTAVAGRRCPAGVQPVGGGGEAEPRAQ